MDNLDSVVLCGVMNFEGFEIFRRQGTRLDPFSDYRDHINIYEVFCRKTDQVALFTDITEAKLFILLLKETE